MAGKPSDRSPPPTARRARLTRLSPRPHRRSLRRPARRRLTPPPLDPATLLLFSVALDGLTLSEGLGAYGSPDDPLIPVGELARLLEADIDVLPADRRIVGRLGESRRALVVDLKAGVARVAGATSPSRKTMWR